MVTSTRLTLDQFLAMRDIDERRLELIDGEVYEKVSPRWGHGRIAGELYQQLSQHGYASVETRAIIPPVGGFAASAPLPDVAFYRTSPPPDDDWMREPPDVVVEVLSLGQSRREMRAKVELYVAFGVKSVWVADLERESIDVYEEGGRRTFARGEELETAHVPGLRLAVGQLFDPPAPATEN
ncbi:MAG: Uma2 family endonuclease [Hyphomicrobiales bacterium]